MSFDNTFFNGVKIRMPPTENEGTISNGLERVQDTRGICVFEKYKDQPSVSQKTDNRDITKDGFPVKSGPSHPFLLVHRTILQASNECLVT